MLERFFIFLCFYLPFSLALNVRADVDLSSVRVLTSVAFFVFLAESLRRRRVEIGRGFVGISLVSFLFIAVLSIFWAKNPEWSARKILFLFSLAPLFLLSNWYSSKEGLVRPIKSLVLSASLISIIGLGQFLAQFVFSIDEVYAFWAKNLAPLFLGKSFSSAVLANSSWLVNISGKTYFRVISVFPDPHMLSLFLGLILPVSLSLALSQKKFFWWASFGLIFLADALTFSRGGYIGISAALVFWGIFSWNDLGRNLRVGIFLGLLFLISLFTFPNLVRERFLSSFNFKEGSNKERIKTWGQAKEIIEKHWLLGVGIGNYPLEVKSTASYREPIYAHNVFLDIFSETGILGLSSFISFLMSLVVLFLRKSGGRGFSLALAMGLVIFFFHSLFETGIYSPAVFGVLLIIAGFSGAYVKR